MSNKVSQITLSGLILALFALVAVLSPAQANSLDTSFGSSGFITTLDDTWNSFEVMDQQIQNDGKILLAGGSVDSDDVPVMTLIRLNANGTIDEDFGDDGAFIFSNAELAVEYTLTSSDIQSAYITSIDIQSNGKIVAAAAFSFGSPTTYVTILMRINTNGTLDRTYGVDGFYEIMLEGDTDANSWPKIITLDGFYRDWTIVAVTDDLGKLRVLRFSTTGTRYNYNVTSGIDLDAIYTLKESADSSIIFLSSYGASYFLIKLNAFGDLDEDFGDDGISEIQNTFNVADIQLSGSDRYFTIGYTSSDVPTIKKYKFDGTLDTTFGVSGVTTISLPTAALEAGVFDANGNLLVLGRISDAGVYTPFISKIKPNGALDSSFGSSGTYTFSSGYRPYYIDIFNNLIYFSGDEVGGYSFVAKFKYTLSTTGGGSSSTVVSPIVTKTKKYAITGFRANSFYFNSSVRKNISSARKSMRGKNVLKITCTGFVGKTSSSQPTAILRLIANKRSERVCNALKPYYPNATIVRSFKIVKGGSANLRKTNVTFTFS